MSQISRAPKSRREEIKQDLTSIPRAEGSMAVYCRKMCFILAAEVDALRSDRDLWCARCEAIVAMLEPNYANDEMYRENKHVARLHAAAIKIMKGEE